MFLTLLFLKIFTNSYIVFPVSTISSIIKIFRFDISFSIPKISFKLPLVLVPIYEETFMKAISVFGILIFFIRSDANKKDPFKTTINSGLFKLDSFIFLANDDTI